MDAVDVLGLARECLRCFNCPIEYTCEPCDLQCLECDGDPGCRNQCGNRCRNAKIKMNCGQNNDDQRGNNGGGGGGDDGRVRRCVIRCMKASGSDWALGALGAGSIFGGSLPLKGLVGRGVAGGGKSGSTWTTLPSMAGTFMGGRTGFFGNTAEKLRDFGRKANPVGRAVQSAALGYLAGNAASCGIICAGDPHAF